MTAPRALPEAQLQGSFPTDVKELIAAIVRGGFPDLWRDRSIDSNAFYRAYLSSYLERDVRQILALSLK